MYMYTYVYTHTPHTLYVYRAAGVLLREMCFFFSVCSNCNLEASYSVAMFVRIFPIIF